MTVVIDNKQSKVEASIFMEDLKQCFPYGKSCTICESTYTFPLFNWMSNYIQFIYASSITELCARKCNCQGIALVETKYRSFWDMKHWGLMLTVLLG